MGAYHESELPMIFGTHPLYRGNSTRLEYETSHVMQDAWLAFAADGGDGLKKLGWPVYHSNAGAAIIFGNGSSVYTEDLSGLEAGCLGRTGRPVL